MPYDSGSSHNGENDVDEDGSGLPLPVSSFLRDLYAALVDNDVATVRYSYFKGWRALTSSYYAESEWPAATHAGVQQVCEGNEVFLLLLSLIHI